MTKVLKGSTVLVTGGAGFIGSHIVDLALAAGASEVRVIDDLVRGSRDNLAAATESGRLRLEVADIRDPEVVDELVAGCDFVFHQAALRITHCAAEPRLAVEVMINGTQNVLESAVRHSVGKVLAASSASVYGEASLIPMDEATHPFNNRTLYGAAKIANEQMLRAYAEMHGLRYVAIRPFNVYGPRMDVYGAYTEVMIRWLDRLGEGARPVIFGDGLQTMDFVYVEDVARAYLLAAEADVTDRVYNCGFGVETSLRELCVRLCAAAGHANVTPEFQPPRQVNPVTRRLAAVAAAERDLGFRAEVDLDQGLGRLVEWYRAKREARVLAPA